MTAILVNQEHEFIHCWPEAPEEVSFLRNPHRHILHIKLQLQVFHNDRDLEFIMVKRSLDKYLEETLPTLELRTSCEDVAKLVWMWAKDTYGRERYCTVEVMEDGENGVRYEKD